VFGVGMEGLSDTMERKAVWKTLPYPGSIVETMDTAASRTQQVRPLID